MQAAVAAALASAPPGSGTVVAVAKQGKKPEEKPGEWTWVAALVLGLAGLVVVGVTLYLLLSDQPAVSSTKKTATIKSVVTTTKVRDANVETTVVAPKATKKTSTTTTTTLNPSMTTTKTVSPSKNPRATLTVIETSRARPSDALVGGLIALGAALILLAGSLRRLQSLTTPWFSVVLSADTPTPPPEIPKAVGKAAETAGVTDPEAVADWTLRASKELNTIRLERVLEGDDEPVRVLYAHGGAGTLDEGSSIVDDVAEAVRRTTPPSE